MSTLVKILLMSILAYSRVSDTLPTGAYDPNKFIGKWYVVAIMNPKRSAEYDCVQKYVTKNENNVFTIVTSAVCRGCSNSTLTANIVDTTIHNIVVGNIRKPWNMTISGYYHAYEIVLYDLSQQDYYLMSRTPTMSERFVELHGQFAKWGWKVHFISHEGCE